MNDASNEVRAQVTRLLFSYIYFPFPFSLSSFVLITSHLRTMQQNHPTAPHTSDGRRPPPNPHQNGNQDQNHDQGQGNSFPSLPDNTTQHQNVGQDEGQEDIEDFYDAPPPSSQLVKYGSNLPPQSTAEFYIDRIISLPPKNTFPPHQANEYQPQQPQVNDRRLDIPSYRAASEQQRQVQAPIISPRTIPTQTPKKNPFANPPPDRSPQINSSPLQTPNRLSDPSNRLSTDPIATNRMKQNTNSEGTTYSLPPPNGGRVLVKRASKGVNGGFKVPWGPSPGQDKEKEEKAERGAGGTVGEERKTLTPASAPSVEEQQIHQLLSAQKMAAQKRAQAVQVSCTFSGRRMRS